jgi:hypothetical protein
MTVPHLGALSPRWKSKLDETIELLYRLQRITTDRTCMQWPAVPPAQPLIRPLVMCASWTGRRHLALASLEWIKIWCELDASAELLQRA